MGFDENAYAEIKSSSYEIRHLRDPSLTIGTKTASGRRRRSLPPPKKCHAESPEFSQSSREPPPWWSPE
ncbi:hypothetical protein V1478_009474 [Vespula squamosa]|uniref:Uncharacterized protein n=1 Tax=Vespula squamosa TaxID=30214 RepID=A0ABD2APR5_VESSQ